MMLATTSARLCDGWEEEGVEEETSEGTVDNMLMATARAGETRMSGEDSMSGRGDVDE
jgi:hypothetical protein